MFSRWNLPHARHVFGICAWPPQSLKARACGPPTWAATRKRFSRFEVGLFASREGTPNTVRGTSLGPSALFSCGALCRWTAAAVRRRRSATAGLGGKVVHSFMARVAVFVLRVWAQGVTMIIHSDAQVVPTPPHRSGEVPRPGAAVLLRVVCIERGKKVRQ